MRKNSEIDDYIFDLWEKRKSFKELSELKFNSFLSLKTIRNIVYSGNSGKETRRMKSEHAKAIYDAFKLKFLELQDINRTIHFVFENQPDYTLSERTIRRIIDKKLNEKKKNGSAHKILTSPNNDC